MRKRAGRKLALAKETLASVQGGVDASGIDGDPINIKQIEPPKPPQELP